MSNPPYATPVDLQATLGATPLPDNADYLLQSASDYLDSVITVPFTVAADGLPSWTPFRDALNKACVEQVRYWIEVGYESHIVNAPRDGRLRTKGIDINWQPLRLAPLAAEALRNAALLRMY